ncbi:MAG: hypothetical protein IT275_08275 [Chitinophagales bacterium]|nr:hypothetical protein [Chitinophagales bacterium]
MEHGVNKDVAAYTEKSKAFLSNKLKAFLGKQAWKNDGFYEVIVQDDKMVQRARLELRK